MAGKRDPGGRTAYKARGLIAAASEFAALPTITEKERADAERLAQTIAANQAQRDRLRH